MARWGRCDYRELKKLDERLQQLSEVDMDRLCRDAAKKVAQILLNKVKKRTPVGVAPKFDGPKTVKVRVQAGKAEPFLPVPGLSGNSIGPGIGAVPCGMLGRSFPLKNMGISTP